MSDLWRWMRDAVQAGTDAAHDLASVETVRVAVTGLSRAGKTVFLVSLLSNLLALARGSDSLPALSALLRGADGRSRLRGISVEPAGAQRIPRFPYEAMRDGLAEGTEARWPPSTDRAALIVLRLTLDPRTALGQAKALVAGPREIRLELLDYPGEWLVDLPLLEQSFEAWSADTLRLLREAPRAGFAADFLGFLSTLRPGAPMSEEVAFHGFALYREALRRARDEAGLRWLQPGRFLMPGSWADAPFLHFFPLEGEGGRGTLASGLRERFEAYKEESRSGFFEPHFSRFDRQVVLVDVLGALFAGKAAFEDTERALRTVGESYRRLLDGGPFGRRIRRVAFAATKADHVDDIQRDNLRLTLRSMVEGAGRVPASFHALSSVRCTRDGDAPGPDGRVQRVVHGVPLGETRQRPFSPGPVPAGPVPPGFWSAPYFVMPTLAPPEFPAGAPHPVPHLHLDEVLAALLEDAL